MAPPRTLLSLAVLLLVCVATPTRVAALGISGASSVTRLMENVIITANSKQHAGLYPYGATNSPQAILDLLHGSNIVSIGNIPFLPKEEQYFSKYTIPIAVSTFSLFTSKFVIGQLNNQQILAIVTGRINSWSQIPGALRKDPIAYAVRADPSGLTATVTSYLKKANPTFPTSLVGRGPFRFGATSVGKHGHAALLQYVLTTPNAIGWLDSAAGHAAGLFEIKINTVYGRPVQSITPGITVYDAVNGQIYPISLLYSFSSISLTWNTGPNSWPVTAFVYAFVRPDLTAWHGAGGIYRSFLLYTFTNTGKALIKNLGYNPMENAKLVALAKASINKIKIAPGSKGFGLPP